MISMTWPQYRRRECRIGEFVVRLSRQECELLFLLLVRAPRAVPMGDIIMFLWGEPEDEPQYAEEQTRTLLHRLRTKIGSYRIRCNAGFGARLIQHPERCAA